jgi:hypothetical protein
MAIAKQKPGVSMRKRLIQLSTALLAMAGIAALVYCFLGFPSQSQPPMFVVYDDRHPGEAVAVYPDPAILKKHHISPERFEAAYRAVLEGVAEAIGSALADMFLEPSEKKQNQQTSSAAEYDETRFGFTREAFREVFDTTRVELWALHADGTHTVKEEVLPKQSAQQDRGAANKEPSDTTSSQKEPTGSLSVSPTTMERAKEKFAKDTGIAWPDSASDVHFDEQRVPFLGDGDFYVVFTVPHALLIIWMNAPPPWGGEHWLQGPIPPEIGYHCGFGFKSPSGWSAKRDGSKEYSGGAPEILEPLKSKAVRYVARDRAPEGNPWYNGDLLILDAKTGTVRYCSWDM